MSPANLPSPLAAQGLTDGLGSNSLGDRSEDGRVIRGTARNVIHLTASGLQDERCQRHESKPVMVQGVQDRMFEGYYVAQAILTSVFPRRSDIRQLAFQFEERLQDRFLPPTVLPLPDELEPEMPRILFGAKDGTGQLIISQVSLSLQNHYSRQQKRQLAHVEGCLTGSFPVIFGLLEFMLQMRPNFVGVALVVNLPSQGDEQELLEFLCDRLRVAVERQGLHDLELKTVRVVENSFFANTVVRNFRTFKTESSSQGVPPMPMGQALETGLQIVVDCNDRYCYNERIGYQSSEEMARKALRLAIDQAREAMEWLGRQP